MNSWKVIVILTLVYAFLAGMLTLGNYRMEPDSFGYLALARNIFRGAGYTRLGLPEIYWQPGYPFLVSLALTIIPNIELAGHIVSILCGVLAIPAVFLLARSLLPTLPALLAAALLALNAYFVDAASEALSETAAALFLILAILFLLRGCRSGGFQAIFFSALYGIFSAAAYLTRSEILLIFPAGIIVLFLRFRRSKILAALCVFAAALTLTVTCLPYWRHLKNATGHFRLNGNGVNLIWYQGDAGERPPGTLDPRWAPRPFDPIWPRGTRPADFNPFRYIILNYPELISRYLTNFLTYLDDIAEVLFFGVGFLLLFLGIRAGPGLYHRKDFIILFLSFLPVIALPFRKGTDRLLEPYLPFASIIMAVGLYRLISILIHRFNLSFLQKRTGPFLLAALIAFPPLCKMARHVGRREREGIYRYRAIGAYIKSTFYPGRIPVVMANSSAAGFFAGGETIKIPTTQIPAKIIGQMDRFNCYLLVLNQQQSEESRIRLNIIEAGDMKLVRSFPGGLDLFRRTIPGS